MDSLADRIEALWDDLLSRQPGLIQSAYASLEPQAQMAVVNHLRRMLSEPGWQPEQRLSARAALDALKIVSPHDEDGS